MYLDAFIHFMIRSVSLLLNNQSTPHFCTAQSNNNPINTQYSSALTSLDFLLVDTASVVIAVFSRFNLCLQVTGYSVLKMLWIAFDSSLFSDHCLGEMRGDARWPEPRSCSEIFRVANLNQVCCF